MLRNLNHSDGEEWKKTVLVAIIQQRLLWTSTTSAFFDLGSGRRAKVHCNFSTEQLALCEFTLLCRIGLQADSRVRIPAINSLVYQATATRSTALGCRLTPTARPSNEAPIPSTSSS